MRSIAAIALALAAVAAVPLEAAAQY